MTHTKEQPESGKTRSATSLCSFKLENNNESRWRQVTKNLKPTEAYGTTHSVEARTDLGHIRRPRQVATMKTMKRTEHRKTGS